MSRFQEAVAALPPAYFALVMATGIVSVAARLWEVPVLPEILFGLNVVFYISLWTLTLLKLARYKDRVIADLYSHGRCVGFFTTVAATCVLGNQILIIGKSPAIAAGLWAFGILLWVTITYSVFTVLTVKLDKPSLPEGVHGGWLVAVVAAQSVAALGGLLAPTMGEARSPALFFSLVMWLGGGVLYLWIISLIFYRYTFFRLEPADLSPPYWINMGAMAISTLAGTVLVGNASNLPLLAELLPFLKGVTLLCWSTATWWIPMLLILGVWRHLVRKFPLRYDPAYWGAVFPLGMYSACTFRLAEVLDQPFLKAVSLAALFAGLGAWALTFTGLIARMLADCQASRNKPPE